jgi:serine/threonine protein kinase
MSVKATLELQKMLSDLLHSMKSDPGSPDDPPIKVGDMLAKGDICDLYLCTQDVPFTVDASKGKSRWDLLSEDDDDGTGERKWVLKVCRSTGDLDLVTNEVQVITKLYPQEQKDEKFFRYLVKPYKATPKGLLMPYLDGFMSLEAILKAFPDGLDYRDVAWMYKRLLTAIGFVHERGIIHGAVLPPHVMVHPTLHGAKLIDWSYAVGRNTTIRAYSASWKDYYAPEIFAKRFPEPSTDIFMAAKVAIALLGGNVQTNEIPEKVPAEVADLLHSCVGNLPSSRPQNSWDLHDQFEALMAKLVGKPAYRVLPV